jgi:hypothetical protein
MKNNTTSAARSTDLISSLSIFFRPSALVATLSLLLIALVAIRNQYSALDFAHIGTVWANHDPSGSWGYDGQFYYQMARNPFQAYRYMDNAPFREQHLFYPLVVGVLSLGQSALVPYMLLLVNVLAIALSVELLARLLIRFDFSPWFSLALGLYFGQAAGLLFDTAEPFTYFLVCLGVWFIVEKNRVALVALLLGLAALTREITILFPIGYLCIAVVQKKWRMCIQLVMLGIVPLFLWLLALRLIFGQTGVTFTRPFEHVPFAGIFFYAVVPKKFALLLLLMFLPTLAAWLFAALELFRKVCLEKGPFLQRFSPMYLILLANLLMITLMSHSSYEDLVSSGRIATGLVLSVLLYGISTRQRWVLWGAQFYTCTFAVYLIGTLLHWPSFLS